MAFRGAGASFASSRGRAAGGRQQQQGDDDDDDPSPDLFVDEFVDETGLPYWVNKATGEFAWANPEQRSEAREKDETRLAHFDEFVDSASKVFVCGEEHDDRCRQLRDLLLRSGAAEAWYDDSGELLTVEMTQKRVASCTVFCLFASSKTLPDAPRRRYELMIALTAKKPIAFVVGEGVDDPHAFVVRMCSALNQKSKTAPTGREVEDLKKQLGPVIEYHPAPGMRQFEMLKGILSRGRHRIVDPVFESFRLVEADVLVVANPANGMGFALDVAIQLSMSGVCTHVLDLMDDVEGSISNPTTKAMVVCLTDDVFSHGHLSLAIRTARANKHRIVCVFRAPTSVQAVANQARIKGLDDLARLVLENSALELVLNKSGPLPSYSMFTRQCLDGLATLLGLRLPYIPAPEFPDMLRVPIEHARKYVDKSREPLIEEVRNALLQGGKLVVLMSPAGSGKSVLFGEMVFRWHHTAHMRMRGSDFQPPVRVCAVHFFTRKFAPTTTIENFIKSVAVQLCGLLPGFRDLLPHTEEAFRALMKPLEAASANDAERLAGMLHALVVEPALRYPDPPRAVHAIMIDGVDECENQAALCTILEAVWQDAPNWLVLLASCRLQDNLAGVSRKSQLQVKFVKPNPDQIKRDIKLVLEKRLREMWGVATPDRVADSVLGRTEGSFFWVECNTLTLKVFAEKNVLNLESLLTVPVGVENILRERFQKLFFSLGKRSAAFRAFVCCVLLLPREPVPEDIVRDVMRKAVDGDWDEDEYFVRKIRAPCTVLGVFDARTKTYCAPHKMVVDWLSGAGERSADKMSAYELHVDPTKKDHELLGEVLDAQLTSGAPCGWDSRRPSQLASPALRFAAKHAAYHWACAENISRATEWFVDFPRLFWTVACHSDEAMSAEQIVHDGERILRFVKQSPFQANYNVDGVRLCVSLLRLVGDSVCKNDARQLAGQVLGRVLPAAAAAVDETQRNRSRSQSLMGGLQRRMSESKTLLGESSLGLGLQRRTSAVGKAISHQLQSPSSGGATPSPPSQQQSATSAPTDRRKSMVLGPLTPSPTTNRGGGTSSSSSSTHPPPSASASSSQATPPRRTNDSQTALRMRASAMRWVEEAATVGRVRVCVPRLWYSDLKPAGGSLIRVQQFSHEVNAVAITRDGTKCLCGLGDGRISVWNLQTGGVDTGAPSQQQQQLDGHPETVFALALSPDGKRCVTGSRDKTIRAWEVDTGKCVQILKGHTNWVMSVALTPDAKTCLSGSLDTTVRVWDVGSGKTLRAFEGHGSGVSCVALTQDAKLCASASSDRVVRVWEVASGRLLHVLKGHGKEVMGVAWYASGRSLVSVSTDQSVRIWDAESGRAQKVLQGTAGWLCVAVSPDDKYIVTGGSDRLVHVWDVFEGKETRVFEGHTHSVLGLAFSSAASTGIVSASKDGTCRQWEFSESGGGLEGHTLPVTAVAVSKDNRVCVTGSGDCSVRVWDLSTGRCTHNLGHPSPITSVAMSLDAQYLVAGMQDSSARIWGVFTGKMVCILKGHTKAISSLSVSSDGKVCVTGSEDFSARVWDVLSGRTLHALNLPAAVDLVYLSQDGRSVVVKGKFGSRCFDVKTGRETPGAALLGTTDYDGPHRGTMAGPRFVTEGDIGFTLDADATHVNVQKSVLYGPCGKKFFVWDVVG